MHSTQTISVVRHYYHYQSSAFSFINSHGALLYGKRISNFIEDHNSYIQTTRNTHSLVSSFQIRYNCNFAWAMSRNEMRPNHFDYSNQAFNHSLYFSSAIILVCSTHKICVIIDCINCRCELSSVIGCP